MITISIILYVSAQTSWLKWPMDELNVNVIIIMSIVTIINKCHINKATLYVSAQTSWLKCPMAELNEKGLTSFLLNSRTCNISLDAMYRNISLDWMGTTIY